MEERFVEGRSVEGCFLEGHFVLASFLACMAKLKNSYSKIPSLLYCSDNFQHG